MTQRDLDRIRLVTRHFRELQGLRRRDGIAEVAAALLWTLSCLLDHRQLVLAMRLARPAEKSAPATEGEP